MNEKYIFIFANSLRVISQELEYEISLNGSENISNLFPAQLESY